MILKYRNAIADQQCAFHHFNVVLGDANLNIDLPFGVQNHEISEVIVHENYRPEDEYHHEDIGIY